ncbi:MAG: PHP domain-containing protein [Thermoleophilaceae bacterium]
MTGRYHDLTTVIHLHSTYSDGTGTVAQIARAANRAGIDVVLLTDHDTLEAKRRGEERWWDDALVLVGEEVSPTDRDHYLAFGIDREISRRLSGPEICRAVADAGGFGFAAHPFSRGFEPLRRPGIPFGDLDCLDGVELWSFLNDTGERVRGLAGVARLIAAPQTIIGSPPEDNLRQWDRLCRARRVVAIGGLDAHQFGVRIAGRVPIRAMSYRRSFRQLHTHVLTDRPLSRELEHDRSLVYEALREGRCYIAVDAVAPARGFGFWADGPDGHVAMGAEGQAGDWTLHVRLPRPAHIRLLRNGTEVAAANDDELEQRTGDPGAYRVEAELSGRAWVLSNPVYLR